MNELSNGVTLYSSQDGGANFHIIADIEICRKCGKRTIACPHMCLKERVVKIPQSSTHLKTVPVEPDMRMTINSAVSLRMSSAAEDTKFMLLETLTSLEEIWEDLGVKDDQRNYRCKTLIDHLKVLLIDILNEEKDLKSKIKAKTEEYEKELEQICIDLQISPISPPPHLSLMDREKHLRNDLDRLNKQKHDNLKILKRLRTEEQGLCDELVLPQHEVSFVSCPSQIQLRELEANVKFLKSEKSKRLEIFKKVKAEIIRIWKETEIEPQDEEEKKLLEPNVTEKFVLSSSNLDTLKTLKLKLDDQSKELLLEIKSKREECEVLWRRLEKEVDSEVVKLHEIPEKNTLKTLIILTEKIEQLKELKKQHIKNFIECIRKELIVLWDKCCFGEEKRKLFQQFYDDIYTEETLTDHEDQLNYLKGYYKEHEELLKLVFQRETMWSEKLNLDNHTGDSRRFNDRGGALFKQLKKRQYIDKQLPKVEKSLKVKICAWEKENATPFIYKDAVYLEYLENQKEEYKIQQQIVKEEKQRARKQELTLEIAYGTKRTVAGSPKSMNFSRFNDTHSTTGSPTPLRKKARVGNRMDVTKVVHSSLTKAISPKCKEVLQSNARRRKEKRRSIRSSKRILKDANVLLPEAKMNTFVKIKR